MFYLYKMKFLIFRKEKNLYAEVAKIFSKNDSFVNHITYYYYYYYYYYYNKEAVNLLGSQFNNGLWWYRDSYLKIDERF